MRFRQVPRCTGSCWRAAPGCGPCSPCRPCRPAVQTPPSADQGQLVAGQATTRDLRITSRLLAQTQHPFLHTTPARRLAGCRCPPGHSPPAPAALQHLEAGAEEDQRAQAVPVGWGRWRATREPPRRRLACCWRRSGVPTPGPPRTTNGWWPARLWRGRGSLRCRCVSLRSGAPCSISSTCLLLASGVRPAPRARNATGRPAAAQASLRRSTQRAALEPTGQSDQYSAAATAIYFWRTQLSQ
jgi:hypothetical protein